MELIFNGNGVFLHETTDDTTSYTTDNWNPFTGSSWNYYVNSGDYKLENLENSVVAYILVAGLKSEDIKAYTEDKKLIVTTEKPGWNGVVNINIDLTFHKINMSEPSIKLDNGVLRIEFPKTDEKVHLKIK